MIAVVDGAIQAQIVGVTVFHAVGADATVAAVFPVALAVTLLTIRAVHTGIDGAFPTNILANFRRAVHTESGAVFTQTTLLTPHHRSIASFATGAVAPLFQSTLNTKATLTKGNSAFPAVFGTVFASTAFIAPHLSLQIAVVALRTMTSLV